MNHFVLLSVFVLGFFVACDALLIPPFWDFEKEKLIALNDNVTCNDNSIQALKHYIKQKGGKILYDYCANTNSSCLVMNGFLVKAKQSVFDDILSAANKMKYQIKNSADNTEFVILDTAQCDTQKNSGYGLAYLTRPELFSNDFMYSSIAGNGAVIHFLDTGVNTDHQDFGGRASRGGNYVAGEDENDNNGHGTGTMSLGIGTKVGVAKKATAVMVKVCDRNGKCKASDTIKGIQRVVDLCVALGKPACIVSMSLGGAYNQVVNDVVAKTLLSCRCYSIVAAGNSGNDACKNSPASYIYAVTVAASDELNCLAGFSSYGPCIDIVAPGNNILMANKNGGFSRASGTSFATPLVAGVAALIMGDNPNITTRALYQELVIKSSLKDKINMNCYLWQGLFDMETKKNTPNRFLHVNCTQ